MTGSRKSKLASKKDKGESRKGERAIQLTHLGLKELGLGVWASDKAPRGAGQLQVRKLASGDLAWYYRYCAQDRQTVRLPLGTGLTLAKARALAADLSRRYQSGDRDLRGALEAEDAARKAAAEKARREAEAMANRGTLGDLLEAYADALQVAGKPSHAKVRASLRLHVRDAQPALWKRAAIEVTTDDAVEIIGTLHRAGKDREASKVRSYLRAAFGKAISSRLSAKAAPKLRAFGLTANPIAAIAAGDRDEGADNTAGMRERALSLPELRAYWRHISTMPTPFGALLRLHLLTGAQRIEQLSRATMADFDADADTLLLLDTKGRRTKARRHLVPILPEAKAAMLELQHRATDADTGGSRSQRFVFSADGGESAAGYHVIRLRVARLAAAMVKDKEAESPFTAGDLRRTVETRLAAESVSMDVRAQLQSHGLGGVQARHYDRHDYLKEKREALEKLRELLTGKAASVTPIKGRARTKAA